MAQQIYATVSFERTTGVPRDRVENTFAFIAQSGSPIDPTALWEPIADFYNNSHVGMFHVLGNYLNATISRDAPSKITFYDLDPVVPGPGVLGPPIFEQDFTPADPLPGSTALPDEVAVCLSFHSDYSAVPEHGPGTRPRARDRGRIFFGPLVDGGEVINIEDGFARVASHLQTDLKISASFLESTLADAGNALWAVWSRRNAALTQVTSGWIDNAFDTQRRRGAEATARLLWP